MKVNSGGYGSIHTEFFPGEVSSCHPLDLKDPAGMEWLRLHLWAATHLHFTCKLKKLKASNPLTVQYLFIADHINTGENEKYMCHFYTPIKQHKDSEFFEVL